MRSSMRVTDALLFVVCIIPIVVIGQINLCPYQETSLQTQPAEMQVVFGDTAAIGEVIAGNSGYVIQAPSEAVSRFISSQYVDNQVYCLFEARYDQSATGAFMARIDMESPDKMIWGNSYSIRTGLPMFIPKELVCNDSIASILGFFPVYNDDGTPPPLGAVAIGNIESRIGFIDIDVSSGGLISTTILADSTVFEGPDDFMFSTLSRDSIEVYRQVFQDDQLSLIRIRSNAADQGITIDTVHSNSDNNTSKSLEARRSSLFSSITRLGNDLFYLNTFIDPESTSYTNILRYDNELNLTDSIRINIDYSKASNVDMYGVEPSYLKIVTVDDNGGEDFSNIRLYSSDLTFLGSIDLESSLGNELALGGQNQMLWPYHLENKLILSASDYSGRYVDSRYNLYQLNESFNLKAVLEDHVDPPDFEVGTLAFIDLPNESLGFLMLTRCDFDGVFSDAFYELWIYDRRDISDLLMPTSTGGVTAVRTPSKGLHLFPNPASEQLFVYDLFDGQFQITSAEGRTYSNLQVNNGTIDIRTLPRGLYTVRDLQTNLIGRFIKID